MQKIFFEILVQTALNVGLFWTILKLTPKSALLPFTILYPTPRFSDLPPSLHNVTNFTFCNFTNFSTNPSKPQSLFCCTGLTFFKRIKDQRSFSNSSPLTFLSLSMYKVKKVEQNQPRKSTMAPPTQKVIKRLSKEIEEECYSNRNEHRGICLILEHDIFAPNLQLRFDSQFSHKKKSGEQF